MGDLVVGQALQFTQDPADPLAGVQLGERAGQGLGGRVLLGGPGGLAPRVARRRFGDGVQRRVGGRRRRRMVKQRLMVIRYIQVLNSAL